VYLSNLLQATSEEEQADISAFPVIDEVTIGIQ
jgi:hypothetical protein